MPDKIIINSLQKLAEAVAWLEDEWRREHYLEVEVRRRAKQRTLPQNNALHLFLTQLSVVLNDAGLDMRRVLSQDIDIPWTTASAKEHLWRPVQLALTSKRSTTELVTVEPTVIHEVLCRHLGQELGVDCPPWPSKEGL